MIIQLSVKYAEFVTGASGSCVCVNRIGGHLDQGNGGWVNNLTECFKKCCVDNLYEKFSFFEDGSSFGKTYSCFEAQGVLRDKGFSPDDFRDSRSYQPGPCSIL